MKREMQENLILESCSAFLANYSPCALPRSSLLERRESQKTLQKLKFDCFHFLSGLNS